jgi:hypothetical protein
MRRLPFLPLLICFAPLACSGDTDSPSGIPSGTPSGSPSGTTAPGAIEVALEPREPDDQTSMRWSPKGGTLPLTPDGEAMLTSLTLDPDGTPPTQIRLEKSDGQPFFDRLYLDHDHDGRYDEAPLETEPHEVRGSTWSSCDGHRDLPTVAPWTGEAATNRYALSVWYGEGPR